MKAIIAIVALALTGCAPLDQWDPPIRQTRSTGWHQCPGRPTGCSEWMRCTRHGCEHVGDPNGPGSGDTDQEGSVAWPPSR